jgi:[acyl-carrier-protein] S-malonyltransferase
MASAFIFPGQGAQSIGMAAALVNGYKTGMEVMEEIEEAISFKLYKLMESGPLTELTKTENAQPAIFAAGMVCIKILEKEYGFSLKRECKYLAGHSLGEYTALCSSGVFTIPQTARMLRYRGELMSRAFPDGDGMMLALVGVGAEEVEPITAAYSHGRNICVIANDNSPVQVVISGHRAAVIEASEKVAKGHKAVKAIALNTSAPFHCPLMAQAAIEFDRMLSQEQQQGDFAVPVIMNVTAKPLSDKANIHDYLIRQITERVRWRETIEFLVNSDEVDRIVEIAPGRILTKIIQRSYPKANAFNIETVTQIEEFVKATQ